MNNNIQNQTLTKKQLSIIPVMLASKTITEGVKKAGICKGTYYSWLKIPEFREELNFQKKEIVNQALLELKSSTIKAVQVLKKLLNSDNEMIRLKTATTILSFTKDFMEQEEITERLMKLEEAVGD